MMNKLISFAIAMLLTITVTTTQVQAQTCQPTGSLTGSHTTCNTDGTRNVYNSNGGYILGQPKWCWFTNSDS